MEASQLLSSSINSRAKLIKEHANSVSAPSGLDSVLHEAYCLSSVIEPVLPDFFALQIQSDLGSNSVLEASRQSAEIERTCKIFSDSFIRSMETSSKTPEEMMSSPRNLYEMCGAAVLAESNSISRKLSTAMGNLWEVIASISPYAVSPEVDFGLKITGVDAIICDGQSPPTFVQIKTQRNTLTGSQKNRSSSELKMHKHRLFAAGPSQSS